MEREETLNQAMDLIADSREDEAEKLLLALIAYLKESLDASPADAGRYFDWGRSLYLLEEPEQALLRYEQALNIRPDHEDALWEAASVLMYDLDKPESAKAILEQRLIPLRPGHAPYAEALAAAETLIRRQKGEAPPWASGAAAD